MNKDWIAPSAVVILLVGGLAGCITDYAYGTDISRTSQVIGKEYDPASTYTVWHTVPATGDSPGYSYSTTETTSARYTLICRDNIRVRTTDHVYYSVTNGQYILLKQCVGRWTHLGYGWYVAETDINAEQ